MKLTDEFGEPVTQILDKLLSELSNACEDLESGKPAAFALPFIREATEYGKAARDALESTSVPDARIPPLSGKYGDVLAPFVAMMERELHANASKGDRPGWLKMTPAIGMLEIYYHAAKLQKAVKDGNASGIREYAADVANIAMMLVDVCGELPAVSTQDTTVQVSQPFDAHRARVLLEQVMHHSDVVEPHMLTWAECAALRDLYRLITGGNP